MKLKIWRNPNEGCEWMFDIGLQSERNFQTYWIAGLVEEDRKAGTYRVGFRMLYDPETGSDMLVSDIIPSRTAAVGYLLLNLDMAYTEDLIGSRICGTTISLEA